MAFTISNNSPSPGYIAWSGLHIQYSGETFIIADGNTDRMYAYWTPAYPNNLVVSNDFPTLTANDCIVFLNKNGVAIVVPTASVLDGDLIVPGTILAVHLAANSVTAGSIAADAVTAGSVAANAIGAEAIAADVIIGDHINGETITGDKLVMGTITADKIGAGSVTTEKIAANAVTAAKINVDTLFAAEAFLTKLNAADISANKSLEIYVKESDQRLYLRFDKDANTITLGRDDSDVLLELVPGENAGLYIKENGMGLAQFARTLATIKRLEVTDSILFPHHVIKAMSNGDLAFMVR
jgi:hypothetical protein